jgi:hypothetical protein
LSYFARNRALPALVACLALAALPATASALTTVHLGIGRGSASGVAVQRETAATEPTGGSRSPNGVSPKPSNTKANVACKRLSQNWIRCTMTLKGGATISGTVTMKIRRGRLVVALGQGRITRGTATLTMRVLHQMTPGLYTVTMVITLHAQMVLRLS